MAEETAISIELYGPVGYAGESGPEPLDFDGLSEHGDPGIVATAAHRSVASGVWGGFPAPVNVEHGATATWDSCYNKNPQTCCPGKGETRCCWYAYAEKHCMTGCVHPGMDIGIPKGTPLYAAAAGKIKFAGRAEVYRPHYVAVQTEHGDLHIYGHMWSIDSEIRTGGSVHAGQYLGTSGEQTKPNSNMVPDGSGPHLHSECRDPHDCAISPEDALLSAPIGYCKPYVPPPYDGTIKTVNDVDFHPDRQTVQCVTEGLRCRRFANRQGCQTRTPLIKGETIEVSYWIWGEAVEGEARWWVTTNGSRIWSGGTNRTPGIGRTSGR